MWLLTKYVQTSHQIKTKLAAKLNGQKSKRQVKNVSKL